MTGQDKTLTLDRFESLLDAYGGELSRWPDDFGRAAAALIEVSEEARALHAEAHALERLLAKASGADPRRVALLADRIVGAAVADGGSRTRGEPAMGARIIRLPVGHGQSEQRPKVSSAERRAALVAAPIASRRGAPPWRSLAALAASLAFGVAIGLSDLVPADAMSLASLVQSTGDPEIVLSGLHLDSLNLLDEDQI